LLERLKADEAFAAVDVEAAVDPHSLTGRSAEQVDEFLTEVVGPIRQRHAEAGGPSEEVRV
jgi:adenylosuccinate lyase